MYPWSEGQSEEAAAFVMWCVMRVEDCHTQKNVPLVGAGVIVGAEVMVGAAVGPGACGWEKV